MRTRDYTMAPVAENEFRDLTNLNEAIESGITYFRLFKNAEETVRRLEKVVETLSSELSSKNQALLWSQEYLDSLRKLKFGSSSERRMESGGPLFDGVIEGKEEYETYKRRKRTKFGRNPQPELPMIERIYELSESEQKEEKLRPMKGQFEESEQIQVSPSRFYKEKVKRQKYCSQDGTDPRIVTAPGPIKLKENNRYSLEFAVEVGINKYQSHCPLERQVGIMKSAGLKTDSQTLFSQIDTAHWYLKSHVISRFQEEQKEHRVHLSDESPWGNLGKKGNKRFTLWGVRNDNCTLFEIFDSKSKKVAQSFLGCIEGVLVTDGAGVYKSLASPKLVLANDWCHVRRKFLSAEKNFPQESRFFIRKIRFLSRIERKIAGKTPESRLKTRQKKSILLVHAIKAKLDELRTVLPQSSLGKAVAYTQELWHGLTVFLENPEVPFHTNDIERAIRNPVIGRKNHYGSHSLRSAEVASTWYSIVATCKQHEVDPRAYIVDTLRKILTKQKILMPWEWSKA